MGWGDIASNVGGAIGSWRSAKGYAEVQSLYRDLKKDGKEIRDYMDPYGNKEREYWGDHLNALMKGEKSIEADPGYSFVYDEAMRATQRQGAASGFGVGAGSSGNVAAALQDRASGLASQEYKSIIARLMDISGASASYGQQAGNTYANMLTAAAGGEAAATIGKHNAYANMHQMGHTAGGQIGDMVSMMAMSDARLKSNIKRVGKDGPLGVYTWEWNDKAEELFGLSGEDQGYIAQEVKKHMPEAIAYARGYMCIDYGYLNEVQEVV